MSDRVLIKTGLRAGIWEGVVTGGEAPPRIEATHLGKPLEDVTITPDPSAEATWRIAVTLPPEVLSDGVQTILIADETGAHLGSFTLLAGDVLDEDIRAELDLLRAELDLLKRAFRRHCVETAGRA